MKIKTFFKLAFGSIISLSFINETALSQTAYRGNDGYFYISNLSPKASYSVGFGKVPIKKAVASDACGVIKFLPKKPLKDGDKVELIDSTNNQSYFFQNSLSISVQNGFKCKQGISTPTGVWKDLTGNIFVSGFSPSRAYIIKIVNDNLTKTITSNSCGFIRLKYESLPDAIFLNGKAYSTNPPSGEAGGSLLCRQNLLYKSLYPSLEETSVTDEATWKQQNGSPQISESSINISQGIPTEPKHYIYQNYLVISPTSGSIGTTKVEYFNGTFPNPASAYNPLVENASLNSSCGKYKIPLTNAQKASLEASNFEFLYMSEQTSPNFTQNYGIPRNQIVYNYSSTSCN